MAVTKKTTIRGLDVLQTVYGVIMGLGLKDVFDKAYRFFSESSHSVLDPRSGGHIDLAWINIVIAVVLFTNILLLGIRFFWVPRNLRAFVVDAGDGVRRLKNWRIALSFIAIVLHAGLYYLLCSEFGLFLAGISTNSAFQFQAFSGCASTQASLLVLNALWILWLKAGETNPDTIHDGVIWARSNLAFSLLALPPLLLVSCRYPSLASIELLEQSSGTLFHAFPTSPRAILALFRPLCDHLPLSPELVATFWISLSFLTNSGLDLFQTARHYVFLEDLELTQGTS